MSENAESFSTATSADSWKWRVAALIVVALLARMAAAFVIENYVRQADRPFLVEGDSNGYWELAQKLATGDDYAIHTPPRYVLRVPGFPILLAGSIRLLGDNIFVARLVLAFVGTACCWLTYCLGRRLHSPSVGFWAALFVAINPLHIGNSVLILSETWFTFWMLLSLLALLRLVGLDERANTETCAPTSALCCRRARCLQSLLVGVLIGAAVLVRPGFLPWVVFCFGGILCLWPHLPATGNGDDRAAIQDRQQPTFIMRLAMCGGILFGCVASMLPWAARNAHVTGHWVMTSLWSGPSLYDGLNPSATGASDMRFFDNDNVLNRMSEFEMNEHYQGKAVDFAINNPGKSARLALKKLTLFLSPVPNFAKRKGWEVSVICVAMWLVLVVACFGGLKTRDWNAFGLLVMLGPLLQFLLVHMVFVGSVRYRLPLEFPLAVLGAIGWQNQMMRWRGTTGADFDDRMSEAA